MKNDSMKKKGFVEGTIIVTIALFITKIMGMLYLIPFYATVGSQGSALYGYAYNIYLIFLEISIAGLPTAMSKIINEYNTLNMQDAKIRAYKIGKKILTYFSIFSFLIVFAFASPLAKLIIGDMTGGNTVEDITFVIRCISFAILIVPFLSVSKGFLQGHKILVPSSIGMVLEQVIRITIILLGSYIGINILGLGITKSVGIAVSGAFVAGLVAYLYIKSKIKKNKTMLNIDTEVPKDKITNKEIFKKLVSYAIPFIITSVATTIYSFTNMILILRTMNHLNIYTATEIEFITNSITTLAAKLNVIVASLSTGMIVSLIPNIVEAYVKKDTIELNSKINKAFQMMFYLSLPMIIGLCMLSRPVWTSFYGVSTLGPIIFALNIWTPLFGNFYMVSNSILQGLNKFKAVYLSTLIGFFVNLACNVPLMLLLNHLGIYPFYGAIISTIIGYSVSVLIAIKSIKKEHDISFKDTIKTCLKTLIPSFAMLIVLILLKLIIPYNETSRTSSILFILINTILGAITFIVISYKMGLLDKIFTRTYLNKIIKKLTFNKVSLKD